MELNSDRRKIDANYNEMPSYQMDMLNTSKTTSPDFSRDEESISICPLLTPSPSGEKYENIDPLSHESETKLLLQNKSPSPDFNQDEETALLATSPSVSYTYPLDPLRTLGFPRQNTPSSVDTEITALSCPTTNPNDIPYSDLNISNQENNSVLENSSESVHRRGKSSIEEDMLESSNISDNFPFRENITKSQHYENHYQQLELNKKEQLANFISQENSKNVPIDFSKHNPIPDYGFLTWNWPIIRKSCFWAVILAMIASLFAVVGMLLSLPRRCHPPHSWYQGTVFYEIFPASFQDSDRDGIGDLRGIASRADYFSKIGVRAIRLNSIFPASHYPESFDIVTNLTDIEKSLGNLSDFKYFVDTIKKKNISVILDFPIFPYVKDLGELKVSVKKKKIAERITNVVHNHRSHRSTDNSFELSKNEFSEKKEYLKPYIDGGIAGLMKSTSDHLNSISQSLVAEAIEFWFENGVDGIYLKGLENYVEDHKFVSELIKWKNIKQTFREEGHNKMLMCNYKILNLIKEEKAIITLFSTIDLLDVYLDVSNGTSHIKSEVSKYQESKIFDKPNYPWIHWNIGNVYTKRLAGKVENNLGAILFLFLLPGTVSIFYGDEIGLTEIHDPHLDHHDVKFVHQLAPMKWQPNGTGFTRPDTLPWLPFAKTIRTNDVHEKILSNMSFIRNDAPSIYMNSIWKEKESFLNSAIRFMDNNIIVLERTYPRRNAYSVVFNAGNDEATNDLSSIYYRGELLADSRGRSGINVNFGNLKLESGEAFVVKLDK